MKKITELKKLKNLKHTRILLRADFNVPIKNGKIIDTFRIDKTIKTIEALQKTGASVVIISHIGKDASASLKPVFQYLKTKKKLPISFYDGVIDEKAVQKTTELEPQQILLIENIRKNKGEMENDVQFVKILSELGDMYVNDAFSVCHRPHASVVGVPKKLPSYAGFQLIEEIDKLSLVSKPKHPFVFILGGNKFSTKLPLLKKFTKTADTVFVGGALLNDVLDAVGFEIGKSLKEDDPKQEKNLKALYANPRFLIPDDVLVERDGKNKNVLVQDVLKGDYIFDVGSQTTDALIEKVKTAKCVLWNGPFGKSGHDQASKKLLKTLAQSKAQVIIGGGDTVAIVSKMKLEHSFTFVSTGGGATLDFLAKGTLPGIKALK
jgi:phosphoglycerate kinase